MFELVCVCVCVCACVRAEITQHKTENHYSSDIGIPFQILRLHHAFGKTQQNFVKNFSGPYSPSSSVYVLSSRQTKFHTRTKQ